MNSIYPYIPEGKEIKYVSAENKFMSHAKEMWRKSGCTKHPTGAVVVKNDEIIGYGCNAGKKVEICPRVLNGSKTGEDYHFCKEVCKTEGHSEVTSIKDAQKTDHAAKDADLYLYGHWWCCKNCWDTMIAVGIKNVFLLENATELFNLSPNISKIYISGGLTHAGERQRMIYERIGQIAATACNHVYIPHLSGTDPGKNPDINPQAVWKKDHHELASADLIIAYVGEPSLGVGAELEIARITASDIIIWWFKGEQVSRMALGNPAVKHKLEAEDADDLYNKLKEILVCWK